MRLFFKSRVLRPMAEVKAGFTKELFNKLSPEWIPTTLKRFDGCKVGNEVHIEMRPTGKVQQWISVITEEAEDASSWYFVDEGKVLPWPLSHWKHRHRVDRIGENACEIVDEISFQTSPAFLAPMIYPVLWSVFAIRPKRYKDYFEV